MAYDFTMFDGLSQTSQVTAQEIAQATFDDYFAMAPNRHDDLVLNGVIVSGVIQKSRYAEREYDDGILILENGTDAQMGYYLDFDGKTWLVTNEENRAIETHQAFRLTICNEEIKWVDSNGVLQTRPVVKLSNNSLGMSRDDEILVLSGTNNLIMPYDSVTKNIKANQRFIFKSHDVYLARNIQHSQFNGLITCSLDRTEVISGDDLENNIGANNYNYVVDIVDESFEQSIGYTETLTANVYLNDIITDKTVEWSSSDESIVAVDSGGNIELLAEGVAIITANLTDNITVLDSIVIDVVSVPSGVTTYEFSKDELIVTEGFTDSVSIYKYIDGVQQSDTFTFSVVGIDSSKYSVVSTADNNIEIEALSSVYSGQLKAVCDSDLTEHFIDLTLKSLW